MSKYIFDLEGNSLYRDISVIHCIVTKDVETGEVQQFDPNHIRDSLQLLYDAEEIIGHNICGFDIPVIQKFYKKWRPPKAYDTLVMSRMLDPERFKHSLDSYGKQFKRYKPVHEDWSKYSEEMLHRCTEDVEINYMLYKYLEDRAGDWDWTEARELEQEVARIHLFQVEAGVDVDLPFAEKVVCDIDSELMEIDNELMEKIPQQYKAPYQVPIRTPFKKDGDFTQSVKRWFDVPINS